MILYIAGLILLIFTFLLREIVSSIFPDLIPAIHDHFPLKTPYIGTTFCSFLLAVVFTFGGNQLIFSNHKDQIQKAIKRIGNELEHLMESSLKHSYLLEFTLENDKVYIGLVKELPIPRVTTYIRIIPFFSGYRDHAKRLHFTTNYLPVYSEYIEKGGATDVGELNVDLIIALEKLVTYFDNDMYEKFQDTSHDTENKPEESS